MEVWICHLVAEGEYILVYRGKNGATMGGNYGANQFISRDGVKTEKQELETHSYFEARGV